MSFTAWRLFKTKHKATAFTGEGARRFGGRWNSKGIAVIYASQNTSLAVLEILVHLQAREILDSYLLASISFGEDLVEAVPISKLPSSWRKDPAPAALQAIGDEWVERQSSAVLRVPSVIIETESNYLLNPAHADFDQCLRGKPRAFKFDRRFAKK